MITVIKHGEKNFITTCSRCGCQFSYELTDLFESSGEYINCPDCKNKCYHARQNPNPNPDYIPPSFGYGTTKDQISPEKLNCLQGNHDLYYSGEDTRGSIYTCKRCGKIIEKPRQKHNYTISCED